MGNAPFPLSDANDFYSFGSGSNLRTGSNPSYAVSDFLSVYPQFGNDANGNPVIPTTIIQNFINIANASIEQPRWRSWWSMGMAWFVAHYCTLFLQASVDPNNGGQTVAEAGTIQGVVTSHSVGDVSESMDVNVGAVEGWDNWNATSFGRQFAARAKIIGMGGMYVY